MFPFIRRVNPLWAIGADRIKTWADLQEECRTVYNLTPDNAEPFKICVPRMILP